MTAPKAGWGVLKRVTRFETSGRPSDKSPDLGARTQIHVSPSSASKARGADASCPARHVRSGGGGKHRGRMQHQQPTWLPRRGTR